MVMSSFKGGMDCDAVENGLSESFNSHIKNARRKPIIRMLEDIRSYVMTRNYTQKEGECEDWNRKAKGRAREYRMFPGRLSPTRLCWKIDTVGRLEFE
ncbi:hypothetical protein Tco_1409335 [Tanacetum coccineum]